MESRKHRDRVRKALSSAADMWVTWDGRGNPGGYGFMVVNELVNGLVNGLVNELVNGLLLLGKSVTGKPTWC